MPNLICPVCSEQLIHENRTYFCRNRHSFDCAKEGYVNLLTGNHKSGSLIGDNKDMAFSRRDFLQKGYFSPLSDRVSEYISQRFESPTVCDICCGEGYYSNEIKNKTNARMYAFDISKEMVRLAAKRKNGITCFVANLAKIPLKSESIDVSLNFFAPFHEKEFSRITKNDGIIITVVAGENHLFELKEILYDKPYKNDERPPETENLKIKEKIKVTQKIHLENEDIMSLFRMTPYFYHTSDKDKQKLEGIKEMDITTDFAVFVFEK